MATEKKHLPVNIVEQMRTQFIYTIDWNEHENRMFYLGKDLWIASTLLYGIMWSVLKIDIGKRVYYNPNNGNLMIENNEQRDARMSS